MTNLTLRDRVASLQVDEGFAKNGDVNIHYRIYGHGPALVLQHGFPDNEFTWMHQIVDLADDHTVITPTLRGFPPSSVPDSEDRYAIAELVADIVALLDHLGLEKTVLIGHDWGGTVQQAFALNFPHRVNGLAFLNTPVLAPFTAQVQLDPEQQAMSEYTLAYIAYEEGDDKNVEYVVRNIRDVERRKEVADYLDASPIHGMLSYYKMNYSRPPYGQRPAGDTSKFVYRVPSRLIWGLEDPYFSLMHLSNLWDWFTDSYRFVSVPGAGHWVHQDNPTQVNAELRSWLSSVE